MALEKQSTLTIISKRIYYLRHSSGMFYYVSACVLLHGAWDARPYKDHIT